MIVLTGASGRLGRAAVRAVLETEPAERVAVLARTPEKVADLAAAGVQVRRGDYEDPASLTAAFAGADRLLFVSGSDVTPGVRERQHGHVVTAAAEAGVGHVVYTSAIGADDPDAPGFLADHTVTEGLLRDSGLPVTLLRNTFYSDLFVGPDVVAAAVRAGETVAADGGRALNTATIADLARAAAVVLTSDGHAGRAYELRGPLWTYDELAATIAEESGRPVAHRRVPLDRAGDLAFLGGLVSSGLFAEPSEDLPALLGRPATGIRELVRAASA
ncbi:NAD(P)H-binding protein [Pseudonocardia spirodelae]|uniref:NAD(P)H-binding protein n=1 Tax=Pseudonocardia spirodelae TaxID=3133431 RepID=A0ABU8TB89_9PSEU